ncbi:peptidoglycan-binding domain-containing protein [Vibrio natriegens]|uniref:peptidoglycan-binding domain-containing protein n=1 Tax=Vibrio natriegens TaxID=691 RepID=UPI00390BE974
MYLQQVFKFLIYAFIIMFASQSYANGVRGYIENLDPTLQKRIQLELLNKGYDPGSIDGIFGPNSEQALYAYTRDHNLPQTTFLSPSLARSLLGVNLEWQDSDEITIDKELHLLKLLNLIPTVDYWEKNGYIFVKD